MTQRPPPSTPAAPSTPLLEGGARADYLDRLNPEQREAIETTEGPLLILAGAGTGKTRVLTTRFAHILLTGRARPHQILAVTFTNKAAREMRERVGALLGGPAEGLWLGTFHAICARMLRRHAEYVGLTSGFTILDTDDQLRLVKQVMEPYRIDTKRWPPQGLLGIIQRWKDRGLTPERVTPAEDSDFAGSGTARRVYAEYQARLAAVNACDFGDLMLHMVEILRTRPDVLAQYHRLFRYILVDEYQDTNTIQYLWLRLLAKREGQPANIACVGDDDQSIYSWRGAEVENILRFEQDFPGARVVRLERNYRSTAQILAAAAGLIAHNDGRLGKTLRPGREDAEGDPVQVVGVWDSDEEARIVSGAIERLRADGHSLAEIAILMRAGFQTRPFEEQLMTRGIPYRVVGGLRFYERTEIRDSLAYLRVLTQPADDLAFERIVNVPRRGVGTAALQKFHLDARQQGVPLSRAVENQLAQPGKGKSREALQALMDAFARARETLGREGQVVACEQLLEDAGYLQMWRDDRSPEAPGRLDNIRELLRALGDFATLEGFLEHVALVTEGEEAASEEKVSLMTLHGAKGLEFDTVFLPGWEEGVFPSQRSLDEGGLKSLEEERRLAYVGLTRARRNATILHAARRRVYANWQDSIPSRFIEEIPAAHVRHAGQTMQERRQLAAQPSVFAFGPLSSRRPGVSTPRNPAPRVTDAYQGAPTTIGLGARVFHQKFGYGVVTAVDCDRLQVNFEQAGEKRVMAGFVEEIS